MSGGSELQLWDGKTPLYDDKVVLHDELKGDLLCWKS